MLSIYPVCTVPISVHVLRIYYKIIVDFERLEGFNFIILLLVLKFCKAVYNENIEQSSYSMFNKYIYIHGRICNH